MPLIGGNKFAACPLLVVEIVLNEQIIAADLFDDRSRLLDRVQIKPRNIVGIDWLDQQSNVIFCKLLRSEPQIMDEGGTQDIVANPAGAIPARQLTCLQPSAVA